MAKGGTCEAACNVSALSHDADLHSERRHGFGPTRAPNGLIVLNYGLVNLLPLVA